MSEAPLKATLKAGRDFDAPWLTVDGNTPDDLKAKLDNIANNGLLQSLVSVADLLKATNNAGPVLAPPQQQAQQAPANNGWGQPQQQPQVTNAPPQQQQQAPRQAGWQANATLHPEGLACEMCNKVLEYKKSQSGKAKWQCPDWRWNNGNPNGHGMEWA